MTRQYSFKAASRSTTFTYGTGYIWQLTPKVQTSVQLTRGFSNTTSESVTEGDVSDEAVVVKTDDYAINDNISLTLNYRMGTKITWNLTSGISNTQTKTFVDEGLNDTGHLMTFPTTLGITMAFTNWLTTSCRYSFSYKTGNEKTDYSRVHTMTSSMSLNF